MKECALCGEEFTPKGRQKVCKACKVSTLRDPNELENIANGLQEKLSEQTQETRPKRPIDRFRTNVVQPGQVGFRRVIR